MANQERPSRADIVHITNIKPGDYFYLCSDGMLEQMDDDDLLEIFGSDKSDDEKRKILTGETIDNSDNHSAYFIHIESVESEVGDDMFPNDEASARAANKVLLAERDPQSVPTLMPPPPPAPEMNEAPQSIGNIGDDDVQVVVGQPVEQQPQIHYQQPMPAPKQGNNSMMKWGVIGFLVVAVIAAAIAAVILFFGGKDEKPTPQPVPEIVTPSRHSRTNSNYSEEEYATPPRQSSGRQTRTTPPSKVTPSKVNPSKINPSKIDPSNVEPSKVEPSKIQSNPSKVDPTKVQTGKPPKSTATDDEGNSFDGGNL